MNNEPLKPGECLLHLSSGDGEPIDQSFRDAFVSGEVMQLTIGGITRDAKVVDISEDGKRILVVTLDFAA